MGYGYDLANCGDCLAYCTVTTPCFVVLMLLLLLWSTVEKSLQHLQPAPVAQLRNQIRDLIEGQYGGYKTFETLAAVSAAPGPS